MPLRHTKRANKRLRGPNCRIPCRENGITNGYGSLSRHLGNKFLDIVRFSLQRFDPGHEMPCLTVLMTKQSFI